MDECAHLRLTLFMITSGAIVKSKVSSILYLRNRQRSWQRYVHYITHPCLQVQKIVQVLIKNIRILGVCEKH